MYSSCSSLLSPLFSCSVSVELLSLLLHTLCNIVYSVIFHPQTKLHLSLFNNGVNSSLSLSLLTPQFTLLSFPSHKSHSLTQLHSLDLSFKTQIPFSLLNHPLFRHLRFLRRFRYQHIQWWDPHWKESAFYLLNS